MMPPGPPPASLSAVEAEAQRRPRGRDRQLPHRPVVNEIVDEHLTPGQRCHRSPPTTRYCRRRRRPAPVDSTRRNCKPGGRNRSDRRWRPNYRKSSGTHRPTPGRHTGRWCCGSAVRPAADPLAGSLTPATRRSHNPNRRRFDPQTLNAQTQCMVLL